MKKLFVLASFALATMTAAAQQVAKYLDPQAPLEERVKDALSRMTVHEKIQMLHAQSKFTSAGVPRLGIRQLNMDDGPHGVREELEWNTWNPARWTNDSIVAFPSLTCLAATWNRDLARNYGHSVSEEFAFRGKDIMLGPGVNIARTPMNGRAFEYMGEDPFLASEIVVPYIQGAQNNGVACCLKHFVLNDQEVDRFNVNVNVSERALHEIYLEPFRQAVKRAHVWTIMGSYNLWKGVHATHNDELINGILKRGWNWDGAVISDWGGTTNTQQAVYGGLDIEMGTYTDGKVKESEFGYNDYYLADKFEQLVKEGKVPMSVLNDKAARVLRTIFRSAMNPKKVIGKQCSEDHYDVCRQIGEEGIVLLANGGVLPLDLSQYNNILVVGENATRSLTQGGGSSELKTLRDISPLQALQQVVKGKVEFAQGYASGRAIYDNVDKVDPALNERLKAEALEKAKKADLIVYIGGMNKNHHQDCENGDRESYDLSFGQNELIDALVSSKPAPCKLVVVTFGGNPFATPWLQKVDAFVHCWYLGSEAGTALANVLTGKVNPSGKLPVTFAKSYNDYPFASFGERAYPGLTGIAAPANSAGEVPNRQVYYDEDIFVGYRGFDKLGRQANFPFGFGLSYTTFQYAKPTIEKTADGSWKVTVSVTNTGSREGKETVQLYVGQQRYAKVTKKLNYQTERPVKELKDFAKLSLKPGETKTATFTINAAKLAIWDEATHQWTTPSGKYRAYVGASSADIKGTADFSL